MTSRQLITSLSLGLVAVQAATAVSLSALTYGYDVFVKEDTSLNGVHIHGSLATGGNLILEGGFTNFNQDAAYVSPFAVVAGNAIVQNADGRVIPNNGTGKIRMDGGLTSGQSVTVSGNQIKLHSNGRTLDLDNTNQTPAEILSGSGIDFSTAFDSLSSVSTMIAGMESTLDFATYVSGGNFNLSLGADTNVDVFNITGEQLASVPNLNFSSVQNFQQKVIFNVDLSGYAGGSIAQNRNGGMEADNILWNFYGSHNLSLQNQFIGSILAVGVDLNHTSNDIKGSVVANSFTKVGGQVHMHPFDHDFPNTPVPDSGSSLLFVLMGLPALAWLRRRLA